MWRTLICVALLGAVVACNSPSSPEESTTEYRTTIPFDYGSATVLPPVKYLASQVQGVEYGGEAELDTLWEPRLVFSVYGSDVDSVKFELILWDRVGMIFDTLIAIHGSGFVAAEAGSYRGYVCDTVRIER